MDQEVVILIVVLAFAVGWSLYFAYMDKKRDISKSDEVCDKIINTVLDSVEKAYGEEVKEDTCIIISKNTVWVGCAEYEWEHVINSLNDVKTITPEWLKENEKKHDD